jgi:hypothetical protein
VVPGPNYVVWDIVEGIAHPTSDIFLLRLDPIPHQSDHENLYRLKQPPVNPFPPNIGEPITGFGYRKGVAQSSKNSDGGDHVELNSELMSSVGIVREVHILKRDSAVLPFPCYQVSARFDSGMSGGPIFDETGCLCGIICANFEGSQSDGEPISYVTTLWPLFCLIINADRGDQYPRGVQYPALDLARGGQIFVPELSRLEDWFAQHVS